MRYFYLLFHNLKVFVSRNSSPIVAGSLFVKVQIISLRPLRFRYVQFSFSCFFFLFIFSWPSMNSSTEELEEEAMISRKAAKAGFTF